MNNQIGQYRFSGTGCCNDYTDPTTKTYEQVSMGSDSEQSSIFQDVSVSLKGGTLFKKDTDYYLSISIPQDMNYEMAFNIKLMKQEGNKSVYQFLKQVNVERGGSGENAYTVALYGYPVIEPGNGITPENQTVNAMIPLPYKPGTPNIKDALYKVPNKNEFYLGMGGTNYKKTTDVNHLAVVASWRHEIGDKFGTFELLFRPIEDGFSKILVEMIRTAEDYNIQRTGPGGVQEFGRKIDIEKMKFNIYELNNLVDNINKGGTLSRIGVWSHANLPMAINGEEIRIGPSGYYELDTVPVKSIGIVAPDGEGKFKNNFTIDYTFEKQTTQTV